MPAFKTHPFGVAVIAIFMMASFAQAQLDSPYSPFASQNDWQWFEPVDFDLDGYACRQPCGFFFDYDKLWWSTSGERIEVGDPNTVQQAYRVYSSIPNDPITGNPIVPVLLRNSIRDAVPRADFAFGSRYDFGFWAENGNGWLFSVLDGPDSNQFFMIGEDSGTIEAGTIVNGPQSPLGDVYISFRTDPGALAGFQDLEDPSGVLDSDNNGDGILDGDGLADDRNDNGTHGADGTDTMNPGNQPDVIVIGATPDYGDLVTLVTAFDYATIRNSSHVNGFEIMRGHRLDNSHMMTKHQNNFFELHYGARFLQLDDQFTVNGFDGGALNGGLLDDANWDTRIVNNVVGPQVGYRWQHVRGRWTVDSIGKFMAGLNISDWRQEGYFDGLLPSNPGNPLYLRDVAFRHGKQEQDFSPVAELRVNLRYRFTDNISCKLGYTGTYVGSVSRASTNVDYVLYENGNVMGFLDNSSDLFINGVNLGFEITQ